MVAVVGPATDWNIQYPSQYPDYECYPQQQQPQPQSAIAPQFFQPYDDSGEPRTTPTASDRVPLEYGHGRGASTISTPNASSTSRPYFSSSSWSPPFASSGSPVFSPVGPTSPYPFNASVFDSSSPSPSPREPWLVSNNRPYLAPILPKPTYSDGSCPSRLTHRHQADSAHVYKCTKSNCGKSFKTKRDLDRHDTSKQHQEISEYPRGIEYVCGGCGHRTPRTRRDNHIRHLQSCERNDGGYYRCGGGNPRGEWVGDDCFADTLDKQKHFNHVQNCKRKPGRKNKSWTGHD